MKLLPHKKYQYPFYMAIYWIVLWILTAIILYVHILEATTDGQVLKRDCLKRANNECTLSSRKYAVPIGLEAGSQIVTAGIAIGFFVLVGGFSHMIIKKNN